MSARREVRQNRHLCDCGKRAVYRRPGRGRVRYRKDHPLCRRCWGSLRYFGGRSPSASTAPVSVHA